MRIAVIAVVSLAFTAGAAAQEPVGSDTREGSSIPGWTVTPAFGYAGTYDDNVSLFFIRTAEEQNNDFISIYRPGLSVDYFGKHSRFGADYSGSLLSYQTFTALNRWDQRGKVSLRRRETARVTWFARGAAAALPSTDLIELGGIPYHHIGARTGDAAGGVELALGARDSLTSSLSYQRVDFDRPKDAPVALRGGHLLESVAAWRHKFNRRFAAGTDYSFRRAAVTGDVEQFSIHATEVGVDFELSPSWSVGGGFGFAYLESTTTTAPRTGPAWRATLDRHRGASFFGVHYVRSFIPSFGFGGSIENQEAGVSYRTALFGSRRWYTNQSAVFRDDKPLTDIFQQLPLRSLRTNSALGWAPQPWVRVEVFYARVQQTSLRFAGQLYRNRVGFQIVTSKPVRVS